MAEPFNIVEIQSTLEEKSDTFVDTDEMLKSTMNEIIRILELDEIEKKDEILKDLTENGRRSLNKYQDDLIPELYTAAMNEDHSILLENLKKYFEQIWKVHYGSKNQWFLLFLTQYQDEGNHDLYKRILNRTAEHGNKYMQNCPVLSIVLQLLFEGIDDQCLIESNVFNDLWSTITNDGLKSIIKYREYIAEDVMNDLINKKQSVLFQALCEYYRPELFKLMKDSSITDRKQLYELALNNVAEHGWLEGVEAVQNKIVPNYFKKLLEKLPSKKQEQQNKEYQWCWQSNNDPWSNGEEAQFTAYRADINKTIETAFLNNLSEVILNEQYKIDFKNQVQISLTYAQRRRPVIRRELVLPNGITTTTIDNQRYLLSSYPVRTSTNDTRYHGCDFVVNWFITITKGTLKMSLAEIVQLAIEGIETEARLYPEKEQAIRDAHRFVQQLRQGQHETKIKIQQICIQLYTEEAFLYRIINETLRDNDQKKSKTLGPICYLLYDYIGRSQNLQDRLTNGDILYRGERVTSDLIEQFKKSIGTNQIWKWTQFISTSKQRSIAERFGDGYSLFQIQMKEPHACEQGVSISSLSRFTIEHEVLLPPGIRFKVTKIDLEENTKRHLIYIDIVPSKLSTLS